MGSKNSNLLYFAPANSIHSYRWIYHIKKKYSYNVFWVSYHDVEEKFEKEYPGFKYLILHKENKFLNSSNLFKKFLGIYYAVRKINNFFFKNNCNFIHVQSLAKYGISCYFLNKKIKYIGTAWGSDVIFSGKGIQYYFLKKTLERAKFVTCDADHMIDRLKSIDKNINVKTVNFGVETGIYNPKNINYKNNGYFTILSLRNHYPVYDIETLIYAFSEFSNSVKSRLIIAGYGDLTENYRKITEKLGIEKKVIFTGKYNRRSLFDLLSQTDLYVSTSKSDAGIAASTAEVMACNIPVLISDSGENKLWIEDNKNGFLFKTSDTNDLIYKLQNISNIGHKKLDQISCNGLKLIKERNSLDIEILKLINLYRKL